MTQIESQTIFKSNVADFSTQKFRIFTYNRKSDFLIKKTKLYFVFRPRSSLSCIIIILNENVNEKFSLFVDQKILVRVCLVCIKSHE